MSYYRYHFTSNIIYGNTLIYFEFYIIANSYKLHDKIEIQTSKPINFIYIFMPSGLICDLFNINLQEKFVSSSYRCYDLTSHQIYICLTICYYIYYDDEYCFACDALVFM